MRKILCAVCLFISFPMSASLDEAVRAALAGAVQELAGLSASSNSSITMPGLEGNVATSGSRDSDSDDDKLRPFLSMFIILALLVGGGI